MVLHPLTSAITTGEDAVLSPAAVIISYDSHTRETYLLHKESNKLMDIKCLAALVNDRGSQLASDC